MRSRQNLSDDMPENRSVFSCTLQSLHIRAARIDRCDVIGGAVKETNRSIGNVGVVDVRRGHGA